MRRSLRARLDRVVDALSPGSIRRGFEAAQRKLGITRSGQIALVGFVLLWVMARVVAGTAMYLFAYGLLLLVGMAYLIAPHRLRMTGTRARFRAAWKSEISLRSSGLESHARPERVKICSDSQPSAEARSNALCSPPAID